MKRIIFSVWSDLGPGWEEYKPILTEKHKDYAYFCDADYGLYDTKLNFVDLQFYKIHLAEQLVNDYDEVLYLDLDVIPKRLKSFFDVHDLNNICCHRTSKPDWKINLKRYMLDGTGEHNIINTGVFGMNKQAADQLMFSERYGEVEKVYYECDVHRLYKPNNEVFLSYIIEKYNVPFTDIGIQWNYILDQVVTQYTPACYFLHQSNKEFGDVLDNINYSF